MKISIVGSHNNFNGTSSKTENDELILVMEKKIESIKVTFKTIFLLY
jgi:hypothetical protein